MKLAKILVILALVLGSIAGVFSFLFDLLRELFTGAGVYGIITVAGTLLFIVSIVSIAKGWAMKQVIKDVLFGLFGYGLGKRNREFTQEEVEDLIRSFLRGVPLEAVIDYWAEANSYDRDSGYVADRLRDKADEMDF